MYVIFYAHKLPLSHRLLLRKGTKSRVRVQRSSVSKDCVYTHKQNRGVHTDVVVVQFQDVQLKAVLY